MEPRLRGSVACVLDAPQTFHGAEERRSTPRCVRFAVDRGDEEFAKETRFFGADHRGTITRYGLHSREQHTPSLCYAPVMHFNAIVDD